MLEALRVLAGHGHRRLPARRGALPLRAGGHQRREPARDPRVPRARSARWSTTKYPGRVLLPRPTSGRPTSSTTSATRGRWRRVPHVLPLPGDAAHLHGRAPGVALPDLRDPGADPGDPRRLPVGHLPAQPRRADPRDGHRRGARLHVRRVRQGPADEGQHRHPPAAGAAARQRHATEIELFPALLLSLPGSPVLYYGDEIGMGDNIWLGDRDGVRTPMQWTPDRNAGFSAATPGQALPAGRSGPRLRLPGHVNVEAAAGERAPRCCTGPGG